MLKKGKIYIIISILTVGLLLLVEYNKPKRVNWFPSYVSHHKIPYGTYVLNDLLTHFFQDKVHQIQKPPFELLNRTDTLSGTYFFANQSVSFGESELHALLEWVDQGNTAFIASESFDQQLLDTLHLDLESIYNDSQLTPTFYHQLVNPNLDTRSYAFQKDYYHTTFNPIDTLNTTVLAEVFIKEDSTETAIKNIDLVKQRFGNGTFILSSFPKAFTNYFILKDDNRNYTAGVLSYLDDSNNIFVDNYHKSGKSFYTSPMYLFLNTKEFKWAYYLVLIAVLLYVVFEGKRKQRAIPVITPLKNQTLAFTRTIADMYFEKGQQKQITEHKISYFLEYIRSRLHMSTQQLDEIFMKNLSVRSNNILEDTKDLFGLIKSLQSKSNTTNSELEQLNKKIEAFKAKVDGK
ncbi:DUF4350 domain-containing protein [Flagellimonas onchidii]|uniref:DUF4350 domain-containing protein n=1 Tax=Flagellimonas onchidii TaxID=2562684 RepID=UPI0010A5DEF5|nr:DUF4350 domain-containing protein [Allomuricauda onchidii]